MKSSKRYEKDEKEPKHSPESKERMGMSENEFALLACGVMCLLGLAFFAFQFL